MSKYVVSLGGNALGNNAAEQKELLKKVAKVIVNLIEENHQVVIVHGNGPQVGMINLAFSEANVPEMPFPECGAMSQGYIGFHLQNALYNELQERSIKKEVATIVTQVEVDEKDPLFLNPTKPVGSFYSKEEAEQLSKEKGYTMKEDAGRGYRRVVASPLPIDIIEKGMISSLVNNGYVVVCAGGGGIPVIRKNNKLEGIASVIDKDYASAKVAELIDADYLIILTAVEHAYINFNKPDQKKLEQITAAEAQKYSDEGYFLKGSMFPKVQACLKFVNSSKGKTAIISSLEKAHEASLEKTGTIIKSI